MSQSTNADGVGRRILPAALAIVVGLGAAGAATAAVVSSFSPADSQARSSGLTELKPAEEILGYGD